MKMNLLSIILFLAVCAMGSAAESKDSAKFTSVQRLLQYDDDSRVSTEDSEGFTSGPAFPNGTPLGYWVKSKNVWVDGSVVGFEDGSYFVQWDDKPGRLEAYDSHLAGDRLRLETMKVGASRANDDPPAAYEEPVQGWADGTPVRYRDSDGKLRVGYVADFDKKTSEYKVRFHDGKVEYYDDYDILPMVQSATSRLWVSIVGAIAGFVLIILLWICVRCYCGKRRRARAQKTATPDPELGLDEELPEIA